MKFSTSLVTVVLVASAAAVPVKRAFDASLVPDLGFQAGKNPTGTGDCDGAVNGADGKPIKVPCSCPPSRDVFVQAMQRDVEAGHAVNNPSVLINFPTDNSVASQLARITAASISLQNLNGPGKGCPIVSTTLQAQAKALQNGQSAATPTPPPAQATTPAPAPPASTTTPNASNALPANLQQLDALTPQFGFTSGVNPTGTGDCDGAVNGSDGKPIKIPCSCPPPRDQFLQSLQANIDAGHAVNNPSVNVLFPTDNSKSSQITRIQSALVTLQNLNGPGKGCPAASTTFSAQLKALTG